MGIQSRSSIRSGTAKRTGSRLVIAALAALALLPPWPAPAAAGDQVIWVALVKASNTEAASDPKLAAVADRLKKVFGFSSYRLIQETQVPLGKNHEQWVLPSRQIYLKVMPLNGEKVPPGSVYFEVYREEVPLVQGKFTPTAGRPLFINGPDCPSGRLVVILQIGRPGQSPFAEVH